MQHYDVVTTLRRSPCRLGMHFQGYIMRAVFRPANTPTMPRLSDVALPPPPAYDVFSPDFGEERQLLAGASDTNRSANARAHSASPPGAGLADNVAAHCNRLAARRHSHDGRWQRLPADASDSGDSTSDSEASTTSDASTIRPGDNRRGHVPSDGSLAAAKRDYGPRRTQRYCDATQGDYQQTTPAETSDDAMTSLLIPPQRAPSDRQGRR